MSIDIDHRDLWEVVNVPQWSDQATPTPPPTPSYALDQYNKGRRCNFNTWYSLGSKTYPGTQAWNTGSRKVCAELCDMTVGCAAWVLDKARVQCSLGGVGEGTIDDLGMVFGQSNVDMCATKKNSWVPKCATHICNALTKKKASWTADTICENDMITGGDNHNCQKTCCDDIASATFVSAGCNNIGGSSCQDELSKHKTGTSAEADEDGTKLFPPFQVDFTSGTNLYGLDVNALVSNSANTDVLVASANDIVRYDFSSSTMTEIGRYSGHTGNVIAIDVDWVTGNLASGSADGSIIVWDLSTMTKRMTISNAHEGKEVTSVKLDYGKKQALSAGKDRWVRTWDLTTDPPVFFKQGMHTGVGGIYAMDADFGLKMGITGGYDNVLKIWKFDASNHLVRTLSKDTRFKHTQYIRCVKAFNSSWRIRRFVLFNSSSPLLR